MILINIHLNVLYSYSKRIMFALRLVKSKRLNSEASFNGVNDDVFTSININEG